MIVLLRGTSGSGKSTIATKVIEKLGAYDHEIKLGPQQKLGGYVWRQRQLILGRYTTACGGCDTLNWKGAADDMEAEIASHCSSGHNVLLEGLVVSSWGGERLLRLIKHSELRVIVLSTSLEDCISSVKARRIAKALEKGVEVKELNIDNTVKKYIENLRSIKNNMKIGINVVHLDRQAAYEATLDALNLT